MFLFVVTGTVVVVVVLALWLYRFFRTPNTLDNVEYYERIKETLPPDEN